MGKESSPSLNLGQGVAGAPEARNDSEPLESLEKLVNLFRKREISFEEYFGKLRLHANTSDISSYARRFLDPSPIRGESKIKPTFEEKQEAYYMERVVTADYLEGRINIEQYAFLNDRLLPFTKLDLVKLAAELDAAQARAQREHTLEMVKTTFRGLFRRGSQPS